MLVHHDHIEIKFEGQGHRLWIHITKRDEPSVAKTRPEFETAKYVAGSW